MAVKFFMSLLTTCATVEAELYNLLSSVKNSMTSPSKAVDGSVVRNGSGRG